MTDQEFNIIFVEEVQKHQILYNYTLPGYSRKDLTEKAWQKVADIVNMTVSECKEKWRNLRTVFIRKTKPSSNGSRKNKKAYYLANAMQFCVPFIKVLAPPSSINLPQISHYETADKIVQNSENVSLEMDMENELPELEFVSCCIPANRQDKQEEEDDTSNHSKQLLQEQTMKRDCETYITSEFHIKQESEGTFENDESYMSDGKLDTSIRDPNSRHLLTNTVNKPFKCEYCTKSYDRESKLEIHKRIHTGERPFQCEHCNKTFTSALVLSRHTLLHTGEKSFECEYCKKIFTRATNLTIHLRLHTGEKSFECEYCKKIFTRATNLTIHLRLHTGEKIFHCKICEKTFNQAWHLKRHMQTHDVEKPFGCEYCDKAYTTSYQLKTHLKLHTGEKSYHCEFCEKTFSQSCHLKRHMQKHDVEKPFECQNCQQAFTTSYQLKTHMKKYTGE